MAIALALLAAAGWGSSDYAAGVASRRSPAMAVVILTHLIASLALAAIVLGADSLMDTSVQFAYSSPSDGGPHGLHLDWFLPSEGPAAAPLADLVWGVLGGVSAGLGALFLYRGLARGSMSVVAPITAVGAACFPVLIGLGTGESLSALAWVAVGLALGAVLLVSNVPTPALGEGGGPPPYLVRAAEAVRAHSETPTSVVAAGGGAPPETQPGALPTVRAGRRGRHSAPPPRRLRQPGVVDALVSGVGFGGFFVLLGRTAEASGLWPMLSARTASVALFVLVAVGTRQAVLPGRSDRVTVVLAGLGDAAAAGFFLAATRHGQLSVVAVLSSLYPAATIGLARLVDGERCSRIQLAGGALAIAAVAVLAVA